MSTLKIFSILDNKTHSYLRPFTELNEVMACRSLHAACMDEKIQIGMFPADFDLYELGEMDDNTGKIEAQFPPKFIVSAVSVSKILYMKEQNVESKDDHKIGI